MNGFSFSMQLLRTLINLCMRVFPWQTLKTVPVKAGDWISGLFGLELLKMGMVYVSARRELLEFNGVTRMQT